MKINLVLGTMNFGQQTSLEEASSMVEYMLNKGYEEIDTAYVYNEGASERILGEIVKHFNRDKFKIATKVNPRISGKLDGEAVLKQLPESLERMNLEKADIFYLHFPDPNTPVESALEACHTLHEQGMFDELGLSNFPAWMVADVYHKCKANGWVLPTVFEGVYNPLSRKAEVELFSALRSYDMRFYAYNPLAGGLLTGKYEAYSEKPQKGRFALRESYPTRYWKTCFFEAIDTIRQAIGDLSMVEAVYRWLAFHSSLDAEMDDAIIVGASSLSQLKQNIVAVENGALSDDIVESFSTAWEISKADSPECFTFYKG